MPLLNLPFELILDICWKLDTRSYFNFSSTCRWARLSLQGDRLVSLAQKDSGIEEEIKLAGRLVLSHALLLTVQTSGHESDKAQQLIDAGASFRDLPCEEFLVNCAESPDRSGQLKFALEHGASLNEHSRPMGMLLKKATSYPEKKSHFPYLALDRLREGSQLRCLLRQNVAVLLPFVSESDLTWTIDALIAETGQHPYYWAQVGALVGHGAKLSSDAKHILETQKQWRAHHPFNKCLSSWNSIYDLAMLALLGECLRCNGPGPAVILLLSYAVSLARLTGGPSGLLEKAVCRLGSVELAQYLLEHAGASLDDVPGGIHNLLDTTYSNWGSSHSVDWLLEQGARWPSGCPPTYNGHGQVGGQAEFWKYEVEILRAWQVDVALACRPNHE